MANSDDEQFKNYLKSFRPVTPQSLQAKRHLVKPRRLFAVAVGVAASLAATVIVVLLLSHSRKHTLSTRKSRSVTEQTTMLQTSRPIASAKQSKISTPVLTKLALEDSEAFNTLMTERLQTQFPAMKGEQSALRVLAKE
jgi:hypothetical protein